MMENILGFPVSTVYGKPVQKVAFYKHMEMNSKIANVESRIITLRNRQVIIDRDVAELYGVETKAVNQAVKRNADWTRVWCKSAASVNRF